MKPCEENTLRISLYLDDELRDNELEGFESHLKTCADCRASVAEERRFLDDLRSMQPLYGAPRELRASVQRILKTPEQRGFWERFRMALEQWRSSWQVFQWDRARVALASLIVVTIAAGTWLTLSARRRSGSVSEFAAEAVRLHQRRLKGALPMELRSTKAGEISGWLNTKLPFAVKLPTYPEIPVDHQPYRYEGARVVSFQNRPAAYVAYATGGKPVSFVALPTAILPPLRGRAVRMKSLNVYYSEVEGYHVITWSGPRSGLTYALVTDLEHPSQSCIICHAGPSPKDRDLMRSLNQQ